MNLDDFEIDLSPAQGPLRAKCSPAQILEIERRCGSVSAMARRFMTTDAGFDDCCTVLEVTLKAGDERSHPDRAEIQEWVSDLGVWEVIPRLNPLFSRIMGGKWDLGSAEDSGDEPVAQLN